MTDNRSKSLKKTARPLLAMTPHIYIRPETDYDLPTSCEPVNIGCFPPFFCVLPSACQALASSHVLQLLSAVTQWVALPLPAPAPWVVNHRMQCASQELSSKFALKLVSNRKMLKSSASIGCTKRQISIVSCHIFPVGEVRQKQWLASPPACPEHYALEDYSAVFALDADVHTRRAAPQKWNGSRCN